MGMEPTSQLWKNSTIQAESEQPVRQGPGSHQCTNAIGVGGCGRGVDHHGEVGMAVDGEGRKVDGDRAYLRVAEGLASFPDSGDLVLQPERLKDFALATPIASPATAHPVWSAARTESAYGRRRRRLRAVSCQCGVLRETSGLQNRFSGCYGETWNPLWRATPPPLDSEPADPRRRSGRRRGSDPGHPAPSEADAKFPRFFSGCGLRRAALRDKKRYSRSTEEDRAPARYLQDVGGGVPPRPVRLRCTRSR